ncbi:hypothetical protein [Streptomyces sp. NPDC001966]
MYELTHSLASWLVLYEGGIVHRGRRENYRVGGDNALYIEDKGLSNCRKAIIWSVMAHIAESAVPERR